jgi:hypothetical protein
LVYQVQSTVSSLYHAPSPGWQLLGKLELTVDPVTDHTVGKRLAVILKSLDLPADFINKVLKSAQEAARRATHVDTVQELAHLHLLVFAPAERALEGQSWGFFRIEKIDRGGDNAHPDHTVEFYLYLEG